MNKKNIWKATFVSLLLGSSSMVIACEESHKGDPIKPAVFAGGTESRSAPPVVPAEYQRPIRQAVDPGPLGLTWRLTNAMPEHEGEFVDVGCGHSSGGNECDPYQGDTSCSVALPLLCFLPEGLAKPAHLTVRSQYHQWSGGSVALGPVVAPKQQSITSIEKANAFCADELGEGWRVAEHHDGWGWYFIAENKIKHSEHTGYSRFWTHINDQPKGNCWSLEGQSHEELTEELTEGGQTQVYPIVSEPVMPRLGPRPLERKALEVKAPAAKSMEMKLGKTIRGDGQANDQALGQPQTVLFFTDRQTAIDSDCSATLAFRREPIASTDQGDEAAVRALVNQLLAGPNKAELKAGAMDSFQALTAAAGLSARLEETLQRVEFDNGVASLHFSVLAIPHFTASSCEQAVWLSPLRRTLLAHPVVKKLQFWLDGKLQTDFS